MSTDVPTLVARTTVVDDVGALLDLLPATDEVLSWVRRGEGLVGWGTAALVRTAGPTRFAEAVKWWSELVARASVTDEVGERYGRDAVYGVPENPAAASRYGSHGFYTSSSWGYRARAIWDYPNVIAGINLKPNLAWSHDVDGYGPVFNEGSKAASIGLDADYQNTYTASLSYTNFFGGDYNTISDRDFVALSFGVNF